MACGMLASAAAWTRISAARQATAEDFDWHRAAGRTCARWTRLVYRGRSTMDEVERYRLACSSVNGALAMRGSAMRGTDIQYPGAGSGEFG